jgi:hypothetical protein
MHGLPMSEVRDVLLPESEVLRESGQGGSSPVDYPVTCDCGFFGMRFDCRRGECPNCKARVTREGAMVKP